MRGNTRRASGEAETPCVPRGLAGDSHPRAPRPKGALLPCGIPASEHPRSDTTGQSVRPFGIRAQGALLPETPAGKGATPFSPHPPMRSAP